MSDSLPRAAVPRRPEPGLRGRLRHQHHHERHGHKPQNPGPRAVRRGLLHPGRLLVQGGAPNRARALHEHLEDDRPGVPGPGEDALGDWGGGDRGGRGGVHLARSKHRAGMKLVYGDSPVLVRVDMKVHGHF
jgi:hypothetical protein